MPDAAADPLRRRAPQLVRPTGRVALLLATVIATITSVGPAQAASPPRPTPRIVNGVLTQDFPAAAALIDDDSGLQFCSGVLVGCRTVLTAAHCVCDGAGSQCQPGGPGLVDPLDVEVFFQHAGLFDVQSITVPPAFEFGQRDDIAVLRLAQPVEGILPSRVNSIERLPVGTAAEIVGFGLATVGPFDNGLKRTGGVVTSACTVVPAAEYLCWEFDLPLGPPGTDANTCNGDSGGPLYHDFGSGPVVAGIGSGGLNEDCQPDDLPFDADVFANLAAILGAAGADLDAAQCGALPVAGGPGSIDVASTGTVAEGGHVDLALQVPAGTRELRVGMNAEEGLLFNEINLVLHSGGPPPVGLVQCASTRDGTYEYCDVTNPVPGPWNARVTSLAGDAEYQLTATILREVDLGPCVPGPNVLCIDDAPGDRRFQAEISFDTSQGGGRAGLGNAVDLDALGIASGGVFWFFNRENPEVLLKVLNGCAFNGHHWVFWSAGTNVRLVVTVTDRRTGRQRVYTNPDLMPALPVTDLQAFSC
jgi:hypothetical protein